MTDDERLCKEIVTTINYHTRVMLTGKSGIGKTLLARNVCGYATARRLCYLTLWLHLTHKFEDEISLYENIAFQIGVYDRDDDDEKQVDGLVKALKEKITAELSRKKRSVEEEIWKRKKIGRKTEKMEAQDFLEEEKMPYLLLILDDEGNKTSEDKVMKDLGLENFLKGHSPLKIIITKSKGCEYTTSDEGTTPYATYEPQDTKTEGGFESHPVDASDALLRSLDDGYMQDLFSSFIWGTTTAESLKKAWKIDQLISCMARKSNNLPAALVMLSQSLNSITRQSTFKSLSPKQENVINEVLSPCEPAYSVSGYNPILQLVYQLLETDDTLNNAIVDCFWHSLDFFKHCGCVHYVELITQWILEGYFDPVRSVWKAYNDGYAILVELIKRGILKIQEGDMVVPEMAMNSLIDLRPHGVLGRSRLRFGRVCGGNKIKGLGKITQIDDMIKTVQAKKRDHICTILVSGNRLRSEIPSEFFEQMAGLEVLILFDPTLECLTEHLRDLRKLRVLVIRNCDLLSDIEELRSLQGLNVLEVSGASSVETISDDFFASISGLQTLNLSGLRIKHSPSSISQLKNLHSLILRDCPVLKDLPDIQELEKLEVVDVHGSHNLENRFRKRLDTRSIQTFSRLRQLQLVDFSESKIKRLPMFHGAAVADKLHSLTRLSLQNCSNLMKLPNLKPLSGLQILDLSGTTSLVDIAAVCFEQKEELKILNLSGTKIIKLPSTISELSNLSQLLLRDSSNLEAIPNVKGLTSLEVFDVSGCTELHTIEGSFEDMFYLREVNLSGTRMETLPELPEKSNIGCLKLIVLPDSRRLEHDTWSQVKEAITNGMSESLNPSDTGDEIQVISREESGRLGKKLLNEHWAFDRALNHIYRDVYMNTIPFVDTKNHQEILEIHGSNGVDQDEENLSKAESVAFVDNSATSLSSIFNKLASVKGCWVEMCREIKILFSGVDEERLGHLETISITNLPWLESICSSSFENLKNLSLDCSPSIITLFPASTLPTSLEVLKIKFCEKLEKLFEEEVELPNLHTLCLFELPVLSAVCAKLPNLEKYNKDKCPKLKSSQENLKKGNGSSEILCDPGCEKVEQGEFL
ncbi:unnamed protein product [Thlaspi arvense]|uniref:NB-ARC domain-containing protein n=1 Tax=Thlaspi arvense TaxID=13288 RepID=A0AAU9T4B7_THLAR|nr:unnamed protein product [Thlaspi arvense]